MLQPIYLQPGDKVALISPSGIDDKRTAGCSMFAPDFLGVGTRTRTTRSLPTRKIGRHGRRTIT